nr:ATPase [Betaproteobacteria bacterium]
LEELRMLSNFQTDDKPLLQTFLLGQPEFRKTLHGNNLRQLRQRVIATYHLGPMDLLETKAYIEHRLRKVGWQNDPVIDEIAFNMIHEYSDGVPRKINSLCDRLLIMGCLEELHQLGEDALNDVINDFKQEFDFSVDGFDENSQPTGEYTNQQMSSETDLREMDNRLVKMEKSVHSVLSLLKQVLSLSSIKK